MNRVFAKIRTISESNHSQKLTKLYVSALTTVAVLSIMGQLLIQLTLKNQLTDSRVVNLAGKQRYRSQEICKLVLAIKYGYELPLYTDKTKCLKDLVTIWEKEHVGLEHGDPVLGLPGQNSDEITTLFKELNPDFYTIRDNALQIVRLANCKRPKDRELLETCTKAIMEREAVFLTMMNAIVHRYDEEAKEKVLFLQKIEGGLLLVTLIILLLEGLYIFRPAVNKIRNTIEELTVSESNAQRLANELTVANQSLRESYEREQKVRSASLIEGQENERKSIAMEIHDSLGQYLMTIKHKIEALLGDTSQKEADKQNELRSLVIQTIQDARRISFNLMPSVLTDFGLPTALKSLCEYLSSSSEVDIVFENSSHIKRMEKMVEINLYRVVQEALSNAIKYSNADAINVKVSQQDDQLVLVVEDNGWGFDTKVTDDIQKDRTKSGNGISNMKERTGLLNATLEIESTEGKGTRVSITVPLVKE